MKSILEGCRNTVGPPVPLYKHPRPFESLLPLLYNVNVLRLLALLQWPVGKLIAVALLVGKPVQQVFLELQSARRRLTGWLLAPVRNPRLRRLARNFVHLRRWHVVLASACAAAAAAKAFRAWREARDPRQQRKRLLQRQMLDATSYEHWAELAMRLDEEDGIDRMNNWRQETRLYDRNLLGKRLLHLRDVLQRGDINELMFAVRADLIRNMGNITNSELHENFPIVPEPIQQYIKEVERALWAITSYSGEGLTNVDKLNFLRETRHAFGRTALVLSGGGGLGAFHLGVVKGLLDQKLLPRVLSGSSVGSIVCAILGTYTDEQLRDMFGRLHEFEMSFFSNSTVTEFFRHLIFKGTLHDHEVLTQRLRALYHDLTFLEAYLRTGRILNVVVTAADTNEPPRLLNYLTAPHVLIWSAVSCSSAFPYLYAPQDLYARNHRGDVVKYNAETVSDSQRRWRDGSLEEDLPMRGLSEMFGVNYYIVSQTNPHIVPLLDLKRRLPRTMYNLLETEFKHRCTQAQELIPSRSLRYACKLFNQPWEGDITMLLPASYNELRRAICNPSREDLELATRQGQQAAFAKMSAIKVNCAIESTLDECMAHLTAKLLGGRKERAASIPRPISHPRIPSWLNLQSMGLPSVSSIDSMNNNINNNNASGATPFASSSLGPTGGSGVPMLRRSASQRFPTHRINEDEGNDEEGANGARACVSPEGEDYAYAEYTGFSPSYPDTADSFLPSSFDCCDRSIAQLPNLWETMLPLVGKSKQQYNGLDFIAP